MLRKRIMKGVGKGVRRDQQVWTDFVALQKQEALLSQRDCAMRLSVEILQLQNIAIVWHYLRDPTLSRFYTIPKCDRHTYTDSRTDRYTTMACTALSLASRGKNRQYCTAHQV